MLILVCYYTHFKTCKVPFRIYLQFPFITSGPLCLGASGEVQRVSLIYLERAQVQRHDHAHVVVDIEECCVRLRTSRLQII